MTFRTGYSTWGPVYLPLFLFSFGPRLAYSGFGRSPLEASKRWEMSSPSLSRPTPLPWPSDGLSLPRPCRRPGAEISRLASCAKRTGPVCVPHSPRWLQGLSLRPQGPHGEVSRWGCRVRLELIWREPWTLTPGSKSA